MRRITGRVQHYAWGDRHFLPELLGSAPTAMRGPSCGWARTPVGRR